MTPQDDPPLPPQSFATRAAERGPLSAAELAEIKEEMRQDAEWTAALIAKYGHPFAGIDQWEADLAGEPDAA
jgi:hypothetical protein